MTTDHPDGRIRPYHERDEEQVIALWRACGLLQSVNDPRRDIRRKLAVDRALFLVADDPGHVIGTVMAGYEGHRGWINYLGVAPEWQRGGVGRRLMAAAEALLRARGCAKINLQVRSGNQVVVAFYERLGFTIDPVLSLGKRLVHDDR